MSRRWRSQLGSDVLEVGAKSCDVARRGSAHPASGACQGLVPIDAPDPPIGSARPARAHGAAAEGGSVMAAGNGRAGGHGAPPRAPAAWHSCGGHSAALPCWRPKFRTSVRSSGGTRDDILARIVELEVPSAVPRLRRIFPLERGAPHAREDFAEKAEYRPEPALSCAVERDALFGPMLGLFDLARRIATRLHTKSGRLGKGAAIRIRHFPELRAPTLAGWQREDWATGARGRFCV